MTIHNGSIFQTPEMAEVYKRTKNYEPITLADRKNMFTHEELLRDFRKGLRNGNWRKLSRLEKALYRALLWYSRGQGAVINKKAHEETLLARRKTARDERSTGIQKGI